MLYDTAGQEKFRVITRSYYQKADAALFVYDVTDPTSFDQVSYWITEVDRYNNDLQKVLVANKVDLPNQLVADDKGQKLADEHNIKFFRTSAVTKEGIEECFRQLAGQVFQFKGGDKTSFHLSERMEKSETRHKKACC